MGNKIFISYKYSDNSVQDLPNTFSSRVTVRDYVDIIQNKLENDNHINKGENDDESLEEFQDETIRTKLADKIFDSSVTIVLVSPKMKDSKKEEKDQWIPWEIAYSLRHKSRSERKSKPNAILLVKLPDKKGKYDYVDSNFNQDSFYFNIIQKNLNNLKEPYKADKSKNFLFQSYMLECYWDEFISDPNIWIDVAIEIRNNVDDYKIASRF